MAGDTNIYALFTHSLLDNPTRVANFTAMVDYMNEHAADNIMFCSVREWLEYREMRRCQVVQTLVDNVLTLEIDITNLSQNNRWRDMSFNITADKAITGVTVEGFEGATFNPTTGLVNAFGQKTQWTIPDPTPKVLPIGPNAVTSHINSACADHFTTDNCAIIYEASGQYKSWQPGRPINAFSNLVEGTGYIAVMKETLDVTNIFVN